MICVHFLLQTFYQKTIGWFQWLPSEFIKLFFFLWGNVSNIIQFFLVFVSLQILLFHVHPASSPIYEI